MATRTPTRSSTRILPSGPAPLFGLFLILWVLFAAALIFNQEALDTVWRHVLDLPPVLQVIAWVLFLPITLSLSIWESDWTLWLRLLLVIMIGVGNLAALSSGNRAGSGSTPSDLGTDRHVIPPDSVDA